MESPVEIKPALEELFAKWPKEALAFFIESLSQHASPALNLIRAAAQQHFERRFTAKKRGISV